MNSTIRSKRRRGLLGLRLWIADVAAGICFSSGATPAWSAPIGRFASIPSCTADARTAWPGVRPRPRRQLPRHRLPGGRRQTRRDDRLPARARTGHHGLSRGLARVWLDDDPQQSVHALCYMVDRGHRQYAGRLSLAEQLHYARQGHGRSGACRDYVLAAVKELEALGCRDAELSTGRTAQRRARVGHRLKWPAWLANWISVSFLPGPSAISRAVALSISFCRRSKNASLPSPGGIG